MALLGVPAPLAAPGVEEVIVAAAPELLPLAPLPLPVAGLVAVVLALIFGTISPKAPPSVRSGLVQHHGRAFFAQAQI